MTQDSPKSLFESITLDAQKAGKEGVQEQLEGQLTRASVPSGINAVVASASPGMLASARSLLPGGADFGQTVTTLVSSPEFLKSYSDDLGLPKEGETREEFIKRGKDVLRNKLKKALKV